MINFAQHIRDLRADGRRRVYLSGPMTGIADHNFPTFNAYAAALRAAGHDVVNPVDLNPDHSTPWVDCLHVDIAALCVCTSIAMIPRWTNSRGANLERFVAQRLGMPVIYLPHSPDDVK